MTDESAPAPPVVVAEVPDRVADDLIAAGLARGLPRLRGPMQDAALQITGGALLGGTGVVLLQRVPGLGRAIAEVLLRGSAGRGERLHLRVESADGDVLDLDVHGSTPVGEIAGLVERAVAVPTRARRSRGPAAPDDEVRKKVFVIHGRDMQVAKAMFEVLYALRLVPLEWEALVTATGSTSPSLAEVVTTGLAPGAAQAVLALLTPDDDVALHPQLHLQDEHAFEVARQLQPRPDVLLELGAALGNHRDRTIVVEFGPALRPISDLGGLNAVRFTGRDVDVSLVKLAGRLRNAGCALDDSGLEWRDTERFTGLDCYTRRPSPS